MKIKSRVNGLIIEATHATSEILKLGNGKFAQAISDNDVSKPLKKREEPKTTLGETELEELQRLRDEEAMRQELEAQTELDKLEAEEEAIAKAELEAQTKVTPAKKAPARKAPAKKTTTKDEVDQVKAEAKAQGIKLTDAQIKGGNVHDDTATTSEEAVETL